MTCDVPPHLMPQHERCEVFSMGERIALAAGLKQPNDVHDIVPQLSGRVRRYDPASDDDHDAVTRFADGTFEIELRAGPSVHPARSPVDGPFTDPLRIAYALGNLLFHLDHARRADHVQHRDERPPLEHRRYVDGTTGLPFPPVQAIGCTTAFAAGLLLPGDTLGTPFRDAVENTLDDGFYDLDAVARALDIPREFVIHRAGFCSFISLRT